MTENERGTGHGRRSAAVLLLTAVTVVSYFAWLGWDQQRTTHPDGHQTGPYEAWQVIGLGLTLAAAGLAAVWRGHLAATVVGLTVGMTVPAAADWIPDDDSGLSVLGVGLVFLSMLSVTATAGTAVTLVRRRRDAAA